MSKSALIRICKIWEIHMEHIKIYNLLSQLKWEAKLLQKCDEAFDKRPLGLAYRLDENLWGHFMPNCKSCRLKFKSTRAIIQLWIESGDCQKCVISSRSFIVSNLSHIKWGLIRVCFCWREEKGKLNIEHWILKCCTFKYNFSNMAKFWFVEAISCQISYLLFLAL